MPRKSEVVKAYVDGLKFCPACQTWFAPQSRQKVIYCDDSCRMNAHRKRVAIQPKS